MLAFKIVHRRGADRTPHCLALIKHREINDHPIEVVAQYFTSLQRHCKSSALKGLIMPCRPVLRDVRRTARAVTAGRRAEWRRQTSLVLLSLLRAKSLPGSAPKAPGQRRFPGLRGSRDQKIHCQFEACSLPTIEVARKQRLMEPPQCAHKWCFLRWSSTWDPPFLLVP